MYFLLKSVSHRNNRVIVKRTAHRTDLEQNERQPFGDVIAVTILELLGHIVGPVGAFELHTVGEEGADLALQRPDLGFYLVRHVVKISIDRLGVEMVKHGTGRPRRTVDDLKETIDFHQGG